MQKLLGKWCGMAVAMLLVTMTPSSWADPIVTDLVLVSGKRITRTVYEYTYQAIIKNDAALRSNVKATLIAVGPGTSIVEAEVVVGDLAANAIVTPSDTFRIQQDRTIAFDRSKMVWSVSSAELINGIAVPPEPDATLNNATLGGVDTDANGIRDDIDRLVAKQFGTDPTYYEEASNFARTERNALLFPSPTELSLHIDTFRCITDVNKLRDLKQITSAAINTPARRGAYGTAFAGAWISNEGCGQ